MSGASSARRPSFARVGDTRQLALYKLNLHSAKVNTIGDRAEDVFLVTGAVRDDSQVVLKPEQQLLAELQI